MNFKLFGNRNAEKAPAVMPNAAKTLLNSADNMQKYNQYFTERTITPPSIQSAMDMYRSEGKMQYLANIMNLLLDSDENLQSKVLVRSSKLTSAKWSYGTKLPKQKQDFYDALITKQLSDWVDVFLDGKLMGFQFQQVMYDFDGIYYRPTELVTYSNVDLRIKNRRLGLYENDKAVELTDYRFINMLYKRPTLHTLLKYYVFYIYAINHWAQFVETYGKPPRIGKYDSMSTPAEMDVLKRAVKGLGTDQSCIISKEMEIEFKDYNGKYSSQSLYKTLCDFVTSRVTNAILGQPLTTEVGDVGSYALGKVQSEVQDYIVECDLRDLSKYVNVLLGYVDAVNFGGTGVGVTFEIIKPINLQQRIDIDTKLVAAGLPIGTDYFYITYDVPVPKNGEALVKAPTAQVAGADAANMDNADGVDKKQVAVNTEAGTGQETQQRVNDEAEKQNAVLQSNAESFSSEIAKSLAKIQDDIRACETLKQLKELDYWWFVRSVGGELAKDLVQSYVKGRQSGRKKGGKKANTALPTIRFEFDERSVSSINAFRNQAYVISTVRTGQAFKQLWDDAANALEEGGDFKDFISKAELSGFGVDNPFHLKTEFETALAGAEQAGRWAEIEADADLFPYLRYVTMEDNLVRPEHAELNGTVAAVGDAFWNDNYPPNGYNCRCSVEQLTEDEAKADPKWNGSKPVLPMDDNFKQNIGKTDRLPSDTLDKLMQFAQQVIDQLPNKDKFSNANDKLAVLYDVNNYPVNVGASLDNKLVQEVLADPSEIWHNSAFESAYIKRYDSKVAVLYTSKGKIDWVSEFDDYNNYGRYGVMEYGKE